MVVACQRYLCPNVISMTMNVFIFRNLSLKTVFNEPYVKINYSLSLSHVVVANSVVKCRRNFLEKVYYVMPLTVRRVDGEGEDHTGWAGGGVHQKGDSKIAGYRRWGGNGKTLGGSGRGTTEGGAHAG